MAIRKALPRKPPALPVRPEPGESNPYEEESLRMGLRLDLVEFDKGTKPFAIHVRPNSLDPDLGQPELIEIALEVGPDGKTVGRVVGPITSNSNYRQHLRRMNEMRGRGYEVREHGYVELLKLLEQVVSPPKKTGPPRHAAYFWLDWQHFQPAYVRAFHAQTSDWLQSSNLVRRKLAKRGLRAITKLTALGSDKVRGRRIVIQTQDPGRLALLKRDVPALRKEIRRIRELAAEGAGAEAHEELSKLIRSETNRAKKFCEEKSRSLLRSDDRGRRVRPQYMLNALLSWKYGIPQVKVQKFIAKA